MDGEIFDLSLRVGNVDKFGLALGLPAGEKERLMLLMFGRSVPKRREISCL